MLIGAGAASYLLFLIAGDPIGDAVLSPCTGGSCATRAVALQIGWTQSTISLTSGGVAMLTYGLAYRDAARRHRHVRWHSPRLNVGPGFAGMSLSGRF